MYYENKSVGREDIRFPFKGSEILPHAIALRYDYRQAELDARNELAGLMQDPNIRTDDDRIGIARRAIEKNGQQYEACCVYVIGFQRQPDREFNLTIGDIVYFGLEDQLADGETVAAVTDTDFCSKCGGIVTAGYQFCCNDCEIEYTRH